ncbi:hypothetical protein SLEP1_g12979 [Rubroshorea leprosula]|uniref:SWIM-type domain-containing protein n=1 Tax=Rubroshorea leprosula TaxID=152421 RepID=A0AAV5IEA8_9ROSI|nr:hypothetical protein SLEP1_g12979 [Rubroshorea leprosula]
MYVCLGPIKQGFKAGCRPFICLDGCFLKGMFGGQLLCAVAIDPNDCMYPLAFAVVESEWKDSWSWFLDQLMDDFDIRLVPALEEKFPNSEHRFCVRHLYNNFKTNHKGTTLKEILWKAARSTYEQEFKQAMFEMRCRSPEAADWLAERHPKHWSRAYFQTWTNVDMLVNNLSESFNSFILDARDKPILTLIETIRTKLMKRIAKRIDEAKKWPGPFCPKIMKKIEKLKEHSAKCFPEPAGASKFQVECHRNQYIVELRRRTCTCRKWDLSGIPCMHAVAAILYNNENVYDHVHPCYKVETFINIYSNFITPIRGAPQWEKSDMPPVQPPVIRRAAGRPKKARRKAADEMEKQSGKMGRKGVKMRCTLCGNIGHNKRSCRPQPKDQRNLNVGYEQPKRGKLPVKKAAVINEALVPNLSDQNNSQSQVTTRWFANGSSQIVYMSPNAAPIIVNHPPTQAYATSFEAPSNLFHSYASCQPSDDASSQAIEKHTSTSPKLEAPAVFSLYCVRLAHTIHRRSSTDLYIAPGDTSGRGALGAGGALRIAEYSRVRYCAFSSEVLLLRRISETIDKG